MKIIFGLSLDRPVSPLPDWIGSGVLCAGPQKFLQFLEESTGLQKVTRDTEHLRVEEYRQVLRRYMEEVSEEVFYRDSFLADPFAVAADMLSRRDELFMAGWSFEAREKMPNRLFTLSALEQYLKNGDSSLSEGFAERFVEVLQVLPERRHSITCVELIEPRALFPVHWKRLLDILEVRGVSIEQSILSEDTINPSTTDEDNDLLRFQRLLRYGRQKGERLRGDGSMILLKGRRDTDLGVFFAAWAKRNPDWNPVLLLPDLSGTLDYAMVQEGLASLGLQTASLARPALQALKLLPVFLWYPLDPYKLLEFVSLPIKPLEEELAARIARQLAEKPGVLGESWRAMTGEYFRDLEAERFNPSENPKEIKGQYRFWFERQRFDVSGVAPKEEAIRIFEYLEKWAADKSAKGEGGVSIHMLRVQAQRIVELLSALPESYLSSLELERIVRTIYEAAPLQMREQELGSFAYAQDAGSIPGQVESLVWWNFSQGDPAFIFSRWSVEERAYLQEAGVRPDGPDRESTLLLWQKKRPVFLTRKKLVLVMPHYSRGEEMVPHTLLGDLEAGFESLQPVLLEIDNPPVSAIPKGLPEYSALPIRRLGQPVPFIQLGMNVLPSRTHETFSSFETLLYFPHRWVFKYVLRLRKSAILSIVEERTLFGNLAHRLFELLLRHPEWQQWEREEVFDFINREAASLFSREGAVLLLYGQEPIRVNFIKKVQRAAWSLVTLLRNNQWEALGTEWPVAGEFSGLEIHGRADIVLQRGTEKAVLDLKWGGKSHRVERIKNREDLQLVLYSALLGKEGRFPHSAFFIVENGQMVARNNAAFREITAVDPGSDHLAVQQEILARMRATHEWRSEQLRQGQIEVRCEQTAALLEAHYQESLLDLLEMRKSAEPFEDYQTLINLIR